MGATFMQRQRFLFIGLGLLTLWRWALLPTLELSPDEAFAALAAEHGWKTDAPLLVWLVKAGMAMFGGGEFGARFFAPLLALLSSLAVWRFTRGLFDPMIAGWAVVVLNVIPAFNLAAITLTPGTLLFFFTAMTLLCLRMALLHAHPLHWGWFGAAACAAGAVFSAPPGLGLMLGIVAALAWPNRLRHHLKAPGFFVITAAWSAAVTFFLLAQHRNDWPLFESPAWRPVLAFAPNVFRWIVLGSPLMLMLLVLVGRVIVPNAALVGMRAMPLGLMVPMAALDLFYGPWDRWPGTGGAAWLLPAAIVLAHQGAVFGALPSEQKISLRTIAIVCAALQSVFLMHSDLPRTLGLPWRFAAQMPAHTRWSRFFISDPTSVMHGWRESARLFDAALEKAAKERPAFAIASNWQIAAELEYYQNAATPVLQPTTAHPRVHALQDGSWSHPYAFLPRYDATREGVSDFRGGDAIFITDDPAAVAPPPVLMRQFAGWEILSVARVMHAGNEVRWLKIFSCHDYRPPEF
ncbi:MAG: glycosyltransferase family 39 protein [Verrucomicrobiaceae bacterium]|nr:glycosyltransferase family 39 protein [Verrucomicrobiaceae bacterium]